MSPLDRKLLRIFAVFRGLISGHLSPFPIGVTYTHACAFLMYIVYILNLYSEDTCVVQAETGDIGFAADGDASVSGV